MQSVTEQEAQARLPELVDSLDRQTEVIITRQGRPVARLVPEPRAVRQPRKPGSAKGLLVVLQEDEEHLKDFAEYME